MQQRALAKKGERYGKAVKDILDEVEKKRVADLHPFLMMKTEGPKLTLDEEFDQELSFLTDDSDYLRMQQEKLAKRVKFQLLIEEMIIQKEYILDYININKRSLQISLGDYDTFKLLLENVCKVAHQPTSRHFQVLNSFLVSNPDLTTKIKIAFDRMYKEKEEKDIEDKKQEVI